MFKFDPKNLDIWGQKSFFLFLNRDFCRQGIYCDLTSIPEATTFRLGLYRKKFPGSFILKAYGPPVMKVALDKEIAGFIISFLFPMQTTTDGSERASNFFLIPKVSNSGRPAKALEAADTKVVIPPRVKAALFSTLHLSQVFSIV